MGVRDALSALFGRRVSPYPIESYMGPTVQEVFSYTAADLYKTQPHLRTVVTFLSRSVAQLNLQLFQRVTDTDRQRITSDPFSAVISRPNPDQTQYELFEGLVAELCLHDSAFWFISETDKWETGWIIRQIPAAWLESVVKDNSFTITSYRFTIDERRVEIPASNIIHFHGWNPTVPTSGSSPIDALKQVLAEQIQAWSFREQLWRRGGRVGSFLWRPPEAPEWSEDSRSRFKHMWGEFSAQGAKAGSTPILEDGMEIRRIGYSAKEDQWLEAAKLSLATVASVYQVNPVMVGILDNANFSNTQAFRKMLYSDTLGPLLRMIEDRINAFILPTITKTPNSYTEFNIQAKLSGDFEEQATILSTSTGGPWMTRNEARARQNLPSIEGGDELITPLNVLVGGQASPQDVNSTQTATSGQNFLKGSVPVLKDQLGPANDSPTLAEQKLSDFFERQGRSVLSKMGASKMTTLDLKADPTWWDQQRWDAELSDVVETLGSSISVQAAVSTLSSAGLDPQSYNSALTKNYIAALAGSQASSINKATLGRLVQSLLESSDMSPESVFEYSKTSRATQIALSLSKGYSSFGSVESGRQHNPDKATKTWIHNAGATKPRTEHARMDGETVSIDGSFSNGANWPGDDPLGAEGNAYCGCTVEINYGT